MIDLNYQKVRESCERIAHVLGISTNLGGLIILSYIFIDLPQTNYPNTAMSAANHVKTPTEYLSP
jgi:hypothetical protein